MEATLEQPATPVCPMTWAELNKKGFNKIEVLADEAIAVETFGQTFYAKGVSLQDSIERFWQQFCDFINAPSN